MTPGMLVVAVCSSCGEVRYKTSREFQRHEKPVPADFEPVGDSPVPSLHEKAVCFACMTPLVFRMVPPSDPLFARNGASRVSDRPPAPPVDDSGLGDVVRTLFEAQAGEEVRQMRDLPNERLLIVTSKRIILVNLESLLIQEVNRAPI